MRRFASLGLALLLAGCGYNTWWHPPFVTIDGQPYAPKGHSENLLRAEGMPVQVEPLTPQPGDVWPGPIKPMPTLQELEEQGGLQSGPELPEVGSPLGRGITPSPGPTPPSPSPSPTDGSSTPPSSAKPGLAPLPSIEPIRPGPAPVVPPPPAAGQVVPTPSGPGVTTGGGPGYRTMTLPGGGTAILVPNGNGTSTLIKPDGSIETIPTPK